MADSDVTTVVISRNRKADLLRTLPRHSRPTVLVDNGSTDGTVPEVRRRFPWIRTVRLPENRGAQARNVGVEVAETPYVAFADDDSWWAPGSLPQAAQILDTHPRVGLLGARILLGEECREDPLSTAMAASPLPRFGELPGRPVLGFASCAAVVRRSVFLQAGGFDPVIFFMGEETRLALDLAAAGWELCYVPRLTVHHHPSAVRDPGARTRLVARNQLLTAVMRRPWRAVVRIVWQSVRAGPDEARGVLAAIPRLPAAVAARRRISPGLEARLRLAEQAGAPA